MSSQEQQTGQESIAIIGIRGRFPGASNVEQFWKNLCDGVEGISTFSDEDLLAGGADPSWLNLPSFVKAGGVLDDVDLFDALFFGFSARDAEVMDPQQRLFLETSWEALEAAGYTSDHFPGLIGVFGGTDLSYYLFQLYANLDRLGFVDQFQMLVGNDKDHLTTQVSYKLNLRGPSVACQTACSTSLVAVCMAVHSLLTYQCDMALAGGVSVAVPQRKGYFYQPGGIMSPDGHCRPFDAAGRGTVGGNGVAIVVLKRLSEAIADGDHIHAIIRGAAINNDGALKAGYTAPSIEGQAQCIALAQAMAGINPETVTYIEAHGTATPLGDPIEISALNQVFRASTNKTQYCAIGSVKSNVGHLNSAAGTTGLIKTVLAIENKKIPPSLHFTQPNPEMDLATSPFYVQQTLADWNASPRRAGVNSFGIGGTNAHVVLEEAPPIEPSSESRHLQLISLSAKTASALEKATDNLASHLREHPDQRLADVAFTLQVGRKAFDHRRITICENVEEAIRVLETRDSRTVFSAKNERPDPRIVFLFPGQGVQYAHMGEELYANELFFREQVDICCALLRRHLNVDLRDLLFPDSDYSEEAGRRLKQTALTQPALFTIEYALASLWIKWGIVPTAMIGHSIGEFVAACLSGVFSLEQAILLVARRGLLMDSMPAGAMMAVPLSEKEVQELLDHNIALAAVNAPSFSVLSGPSDAIELLSQKLLERGVLCRPLHTSHAFHSSMMDPIVVPFVKEVEAFGLMPPSIPYISNVTGTWITAEQAVNPAYYGQQLRRTVRYAAGVGELLRNPDWIFLEVGPGQTLGTLARQQFDPNAEQFVLSSLGSAHDRSDHRRTLTALGMLWLHGVIPDWKGFYASERRHRMVLPTYPFERQRYWIGAPEDLMASRQPQRDIKEWFYRPAWKQVPPAPKTATPFPSEESSWLIFSDEHRLGDSLAVQLRNEGAKVVTARIGQEFKAISEDNYSLNLDNRADYEALIRAISDGRRTPLAIVHLWNLGTDAESESFDEHQRLGFYSLVNLVQALEANGVTKRIQLAVVSNRTQLVLGDEPLCPAKATMFGPCKVIPQEYPNLKCRVIDTDLESALNGKFADWIITELTHETFDPVVAYRKGRRWVQTFESVRLEKVQEASRLRKGGVYLITGGLGQIGLTLSETLAETVQAKLVLTGRSALPPSEIWDAYLATHNGDAICERITRLRRIEEKGGEVLAIQADASDRAEMQAAIDRAVARFGSINGVIHGAGNTSAEAALPVSQIDVAAARAHFAPKVDGLYILDDLFRGHNLDFCLLLSSLSSVLGGLGFTAYAAANAFLDAFAAGRNQRDGYPWISVNWDAWQFSDEPPTRMVASFNDFVRPDDGKDAFHRILDLAPTQIVVSTSNLESRLSQWVRLESLQNSQGPTNAGAGASHPRPNLSTEYLAPRSDVEKTIAEIWKDLLGIAPVGVFDKFFELGGHSLLAIQVISRLRELFQVELPVQRLFERPTIAELAETIEKELRAPTSREEDISEILAFVEGMSEEQVHALMEHQERVKKAGAAHE